MEEITFKAYYLSKCEYWLLAFSAAAIAFIFIPIDISREDRFVLSALAMGVGLRFVLYLNRHEPKYISVDNDNIEITYVNSKSYINPKQSFRKEKSYLKNEIKTSRKINMIILSNNIGVVAKIRKKALNDEDWATLNNYFD